MEVEPRSRAMRRAKEDARRKRRTTVLDRSQRQYSPGPGALVLRQLHGVPARRAARRHSPKVSTARWLTVEAGDGGVGAKYSAYREGSTVQSPFHRPARFRLASATSAAEASERGRAQPFRNAEYVTVQIGTA